MKEIDTSFFFFFLILLHSLLLKLKIFSSRRCKITRAKKKKKKKEKIINHANDYILEANCFRLETREIKKGRTIFFSSSLSASSFSFFHVLSHGRKEREGKIEERKIRSEHSMQVHEVRDKADRKLRARAYSGR